MGIFHHHHRHHPKKCPELPGKANFWLKSDEVTKWRRIPIWFFQSSKIPKINFNFFPNWNHPSLRHLHHLWGKIGDSCSKTGNFDGDEGDGPSSPVVTSITSIVTSIAEVPKFRSEYIVNRLLINHKWQYLTCLCVQMAVKNYVKHYENF